MLLNIIIPPIKIIPIPNTIVPGPNRLEHIAIGMLEEVVINPPVKYLLSSYFFF